MRGSRKFCQRGEGPTSDNVFFAEEEREGIKISLKVGNYRPASETPFKFKWRFASSPVMAQN